MFLCVFDRGTARPPLGLEMESPYYQDANNETARRIVDEACQARLEAIRELVHETKRSKATVTNLGHGCGIASESHPTTGLVSDGDVVVLFSGQVRNWPSFTGSEEAMDEEDEMSTYAHHLISRYMEAIVEEDGQARIAHALTSLGGLDGSFAVILFDRVRRNLLVARDRMGAQGLYWGCGKDGALMIADNVVNLSECIPTATLFPPGCVYANSGHSYFEFPGNSGWTCSSGESWPGRLQSFARPGRPVRAVPRVNSRGQLCGAVYKVASFGDLSSGPPQTL